MDCFSYFFPSRDYHAHFKMRKPRLREVKYLAQDQTPGNSWVGLDLSVRSAFIVLCLGSMQSLQFWTAYLSVLHEIWKPEREFSEFFCRLSGPHCTHLAPPENQVSHDDDSHGPSGSGIMDQRSPTEAVSSKRHTVQVLAVSDSTSWEGSQGAAPAWTWWELIDASCRPWDPGGAH